MDPLVTGADRVKSCLACDRLIAFDENRCPFCGKDQAPLPGRRCSACGAALQPESLHCPKCTHLNVPTAEFHLAEGGSLDRILRRQKALEYAVWGIEVLAVCSLAWILKDLGTLPLP